MLNGSSPHSTNDPDELDQLLSMSDLSEVDMGKYTMHLLPGPDRLYRYKSDRPTRLLEMMDAYRKEERFCDVVLCVKGERFPVHKVVLASASPYFASMFGQSGHIEAHTTEDIDLTKLIPCKGALQAILNYIYTSQVQLNDKNVRAW